MAEPLTLAGLSFCPGLFQSCRPDAIKTGTTSKLSHIFKCCLNDNCLRKLICFNFWPSVNGTGPVTLSEEHQMAIELSKINLPGSKAFMGDSRLDKVPRTSAPEFFLLLLYLYIFDTAFILLYQTWCEWVWRDSHCL